MPKSHKIALAAAISRIELILERKQQTLDHLVAAKHLSFSDVIISILKIDIEELSKALVDIKNS